MDALSGHDPALEAVVRRAADIDESDIRPVQKRLGRGGDAVRSATTCPVP
jgi:hypothetical protein